MLYGALRDNEVIVAAADTLAVFEAFEPSFSGLVDSRRPDLMEILTDDDLGKLKSEPWFLTFENDFCRDQSGIKIVSFSKLADLSRSMVDSAKADPYAWDSVQDLRPIGEIHGLSKDDPWDKRTDEEKDSVEAKKKDYEDAKKSGQLSGESFGPTEKKDKKDESDVVVTKVRVSIKDGKVVVDGVDAVKGATGGVDASDYVYATQCYDVEHNGLNTTVVAISSKADFESGLPLRALAEELGNAVPLTMREVLPGLFAYPKGDEHTARSEMRVRGFEYSDKFQAAQDFDGCHEPWSGRRDAQKAFHAVSNAQDSDDLVIDATDLAGKWFKVEVQQAKVEQVEPILLAAGVRFESAIRRNALFGCWLAFLRKDDALKALAAIETAGVTAEQYGCAADGGRLAPKGVEVQDENEVKEIGPRPWNDGAADYAALDEEARAANRKEWSGEEFLAVVDYGGAANGCHVHIVPRSWFEKEGDLYPQSLDIGHLLPDDFAEIAPGVYKTMSRDWNSAAAELFGRRKFSESMALQLALNGM